MADLTISLAVAGAEVVTGALRRVGEVAINALGAALGKVADFAAESFAGAIEAQAGIDKLTSSIIRLGDASPITSDEAFALAEQFKHLVGGSDDVVLAMENVLLRFDKISAEAFPRVIEQSADLAVALNTDPVSAATMLGKVLQDLGTDGVGSIGRLKAAGVALTDEQEEQIQKLVELGDVTGAQTVLLDALAATTGGAAAANAETLAGKWAIFKETIADAGEGIMMKFLPPLSELADKVLPILLPLIEQFAGGLGRLAEGLGVAFGLFISGEEDIGGAADALAEFANDVIPGSADAIRNAASTLESFVASFTPIKDAVMNVAGAFGESMPMIQGTVQFMAEFVQAKFAELSPVLIANVSSTLNSLAEFWRAHGDEIMAVVTIAFKFIATTIGVTLTAISGIIAAVMQIINGDWAGAWETIQTTFVTIMDSILSIVGTNLDAFAESWAGTFDLAGQIISKFGEDIIVWISQGIINALAGAQALVGGFTDLGAAIIDGMIGGIQSAASNLARAALDAVNGALASAKGALGIRSPSTVFAGVGANMMAGMAQGILGGMGRPVGAMQAVSNSVVNSGGNVNNYYGVQADMQAAYTRALAGAF